MMPILGKVVPGLGRVVRKSCIEQKRLNQQFDRPV